MKKFRIGSGLQNFHIRTPLVSNAAHSTANTSPPRCDVENKRFNRMKNQQGLLVLLCSN